MISAAKTSSSVARKAATSSVGRSLMKPTVSLRMISSPSGSTEAAHGRVERGKEHVFGHNLGPGQTVEKRGFPGVGIAHQRRRWGYGTLGPCGTVQGAGFSRLFPSWRRRRTNWSSMARRSASIWVSPRTADKTQTAALCRSRWVHAPDKPRALIVQRGHLNLQAPLRGSPHDR